MVNQVFGRPPVGRPLFFSARAATRFFVPSFHRRSAQPQLPPRVPTLSPAKKDLWLRLKHYHFEHLVPPHLSDHVAACFGGPDAATRAFATKLQKKLHWSSPFAHRAINEYRKFLYLGVVADFEVTPSKVIDQVWHEHLLFTRAYDQFCREVLRRPFEHFPELVSTGQQTSTFASQYQATLDLYEEEFDMTPPPDIWATTKFEPRTESGERPTRKRRSVDFDSSSDDAPLYTYFDGSPESGGHSHDCMPEFGGGGGFSGGGGGSSWGDATGDSSTDCAADAGSDGGGDGGGGGCSSGCGGGGCGGGE